MYTMFDQLDTNKAGFEQLSREFNGTMQLVGYFRERKPALILPKERQKG
jgi:hypothetical protein